MPTQSHYGRHLLHHLQIEAKQVLQARTLHLEHHLAAAAQAGAMHLGQAGGAEGAGLDVDDLGAALPQLLLQQLLHHGKGEGGHLVLETSQLLHQLGGQHIRARRKQLPELDEGRAQPQELIGEPAGPAPLALAGPLVAPTAGIGPALAIPPQAGQQTKGQPPDPRCPAHRGSRRC
jgi:hypothetical protein